MLHLKGMPNRKTGPGTRATLKHAWQLAICVLLLILAAAPVVAAPVGQTPTPPADSDTEEQDKALVEFRLSNRAAIDQLLALDADLAEYVRDNEDGSVTINAFVTPGERALYESLGFQAGATIEDRSTWEAAKAEREAAMAAEQRAKDAATRGTPPAPSLLPQIESATGFDPGGEITIMRVDYFTNYAGRFLAVAARTSLGLPSGGATMAMAWKEAGGNYGTATNMSKYTDASQYMYHRILVRVGALGSTTPVPAMVRVASSSGQSAEGSVNTWIGGGLPPLAADYQKGFFNHYMDPVENKARINALAAEFPDLAEIINLPYLTNGYQRKSMAIMNGPTGAIGSSPSGSAAQSRSVALFAQAWGQEGGNDIQAEFLNPGAADSPLAVSVSGSRITVNLGTSPTGTLTSTAAQVVAAINADPVASALVTARTWNNGTGAGIVQPRALVNLSDFLNAPYPRGPIQNQMIRIGKQRDGSKIGIFLYCQQHAREWTTSLTCIETAERLLRNYAIDPATKEFVDNLDVFIIPNSNPDGALASYYDNNGQRKNITNYCSPTATSGAMPSNRNSWGVDINRNSTVGSRLDGYDGASGSCTSDTYSGPSEASEPEIKNELWVVDTYSNIKFANNIHSYGGYFMWSPGAYILADRVTLPAPNIGVEAYFFAGANLILNRIKEDRGTVILPERTGPIADVLYSAAGNSADDQWYRKNIISYSFETGADRFTSTSTGTSQSEVGFQPNYTNEGQYEALEFASGNYGLLETAYQYAFDTTPPVANIVPDGGFSQTPIRATFQYGNEPAVIYYTLDGSTPTLASTKWEAQGPRRPGQVFLFDQPTTLKWIAQDIKGNVSEVRSAFFAVETASLKLTKSASPATYNTAGQTILYSYVVQNTSTYLTLAGPFSVTDDRAGTFQCGTATSLAPGASVACTHGYPIAQSDLDIGSVTNTATAAGTFNGEAVTSNSAQATVTAIQTPKLTLTKSADPAVYSYQGQVIVYTFVAANTGNVTLSGPFSVTDNKFGTFQCSTATSLAPGASATCTQSYTILWPSDMNAKTITNRATATGSFGATVVTSNQAQATITHGPQTSKITPTSATCSQFAQGGAADLFDTYYKVASGKISSVSPSGFLYFTKVYAPASSFPIQVRQTNDLGWNSIGISQIGQVVLYNSNCTKSSSQGTTTFDAATGTVTIQVNNAVPANVYYLGVRYNAGSLVGAVASSPYPEVTYVYVTYINGVEIRSSWDGIAANYKK